MKRFIVFFVTAALVFSSVLVYAKSDKSNNGKGNTIQNSQKSNVQNGNASQIKITKEKKQTFKLDGNPIIKYGKVKLPLSPIQKGLGATVTYDKTTHIITVIKDTITIVINLESKVITVNGVEETQKVLTITNKNKTIVLIKYIAKKLGRTAECKGNDVTIITPGTTPTPIATPTPEATPAPTAEATPTPTAEATPTPVL